MVKTLSKFKIIISMVICLVIASSLIPVANAADMWESESNNTASTADRTYDDYNNYGKISSTSDVDWWVISFSSTGMANFYLGNIPSGCDFDMYLYKQDGATLIAASTSESNELIKCRVYANVNYYVKIVSYSGYSNSYEYLFRVKRYDIYDAKIFTFDSVDINTRPSATNSLTYLWNMGYGASEYPNSSASAGHSVMPTSSIFVVRNHAAAGKIRFDLPDGTKTLLYANKAIASGSVDRSMSTYTDGQLNRVDFAMFGGCNSGLTDASLGNLVDMAIAKGAYCSVGWCQTTNTTQMNFWTGKFFEFCAQGQDVAEAFANADTAVYNEYGYNSYVMTSNRYTGSSQYARLVLGGTY